MARKSRRKFRRYLRGAINERLILTSLAAQDLVVEVNAQVLIEPAWLSSVRCTYALVGWTPVVNAGPIVIGVAHSDYSAAEIEEWIENAGSWDQSDLVGQEVAKRKIRQIGIMQEPAAQNANHTTFINDGRPLTTKCGWIMSEGMTVKFWAYNAGTVDVSGATAASVQCLGAANLWPTG